MKTTQLIVILCLLFVLGACESKPTGKLEVVTLAKTSKSWNDAALPHYSEGEPEVTILKITIPPDTKLKWHKHPEINAGVLLKGALTVISEAKDTLHLNAGDPIVELVNTWHYGKNESKKEPAEIIVFYAGIKGKPITILKSGEHGHK